MLNRNNIEHEIDKILETVHVLDYDIELVLSFIGQTGSFAVSVSINDRPVYNECPQDGDIPVTTSVNVPAGGEIKLAAITETHRHGQHAVVAGLKINRVDLIKHNLWIMDGQRFTHRDGKIEERCNGLYHNGTWSLTMPSPLFPWIKQERDKRSKVSYPDHLDFGINGDEYYRLLDQMFR